MDKLRTFWRASGALLAILAIVGFVLVAIGQRAQFQGAFSFDTTHNVIHAVLAAASLAVGFAPIPQDRLKLATTAAGVFYLALGVVGFASGTLWGYATRVGLHLEFIENLLHLGIGTWGAYVGMSDE